MCLLDKRLIKVPLKPYWINYALHICKTCHILMARYLGSEQICSSKVDREGRNQRILEVNMTSQHQIIRIICHSYAYLTHYDLPKTTTFVELLSVCMRACVCRVYVFYGC